MAGKKRELSGVLLRWSPVQTTRCCLRPAGEKMNETGLSGYFVLGTGESNPSVNERLQVLRTSSSTGRGRA
jgi:hypothetical protein